MLPVRRVRVWLDYTDRLQRRWCLEGRQNPVQASMNGEQTMSMMLCALICLYILTIHNIHHLLKMKATCFSNIGSHLQDYTESQPRKPQSEQHLSRDIKMIHLYLYLLSQWLYKVLHLFQSTILWRHINGRDINQQMNLDLGASNIFQ
jgi:hypothetical protein